MGSLEKCLILRLMNRNLTRQAWSIVQCQKSKKEPKKKMRLCHKDAGANLKELPTAKGRTI